MTSANQKRSRQTEDAQSRRLQRMVGLLASGVKAAEGAQVLAELYFEQQGRDPSNNDNYCRLLDWMKNARRVIGKQPNTPHEGRGGTT